MEFTPRLMQILFLLLNADKPIPAAKLAEQLQISKRTIFRELDHIDSSLEKCGLKLERKSRTGFELTGDLQDKQRLLTELQKSDHFDPRNREERQQKLILAMMRLDHKRRNRQIVNIGIVCSNGIGISILLSSKLRHHFGDQIRTEVVETRHIKNTDVDFLISTFPIDSKQESICVDPMLSEDDLNKISEKIEFFAWKEKKEKPQKNNVNVYEATLITNEINSIIKGFCFRYLPENISFTEALLKISDHFTEDTNKKEQLYKDFSEREALSTQVIEEFGIVFLHARTAVIEQSQFIVVLPEGDHFKDSYFKKTRAIIVMLIPEDDERRTLAVSSISNEMFEDEEFLEEIKCGQEEIVFPKIKNILEDYFNEYLRSVYNREG